MVRQRNSYIKIIFASIIFLIINTNYLLSNSVRDFNINGFEIGDSLLEHFTIDQINNSISFDYDYKNSDLFRGIEIQNVEKKSNIKMDLSMEIFDSGQYAFSVTGSKLEIEDLSTGKFYKDNFNNCLIDKDKIQKKINFIFPNTNHVSYESPYYDLDDGKSIAYVTDFEFTDGFLRLYCVNWANEVELERGFTDNMQLNLSSDKFLNWLKNN